MYVWRPIDLSYVPTEGCLLVVIFSDTYLVTFSFCDVSKTWHLNYEILDLILERK